MIQMELNQIIRKDAVEKYKIFIDDIVKPINGKNPKGIRYRKWLRGAILHYSTKIFDNEEDEYNAIGKYGRGLFKDLHNFNNDELKKLYELSQEFGAFEY